jgi:hypothetical protein
MDKRYIFRGNAVGVAGHITKPDDSIIWVQGASSLPVIGGYSLSSAERARFGEVLAFDNVMTRATGDYSVKEKAYKTLANSIVKGLHVTAHLSADALEATLTATHPETGGESSISLAGTRISNLRIDGYPIYVTIDTDLCGKYTTRKSLADAYATDDDFFKRYLNRFLLPDNVKPDPKNRRIPETGGYIVCSIVSEVRTDHPKIVVDGHVLTLEGFGRIFLGELLIGSQSRRLTLLRLKLGSPIVGEIACAEVEGNGTIIL